jgi:hypothetical protein
VDSAKNCRLQSLNPSPLVVKGDGMKINLAVSGIADNKPV